VGIGEAEGSHELYEGGQGSHWEEGEAGALLTGGWLQ